MADHIEVYSIDEAFLKLPSSVSKDYGHTIRRTIMKNIGVPVSVGIGETRTLAKAATEYAKKNLSERVCDITADMDRETVLASILVRDVWGIGSRIAAWLYQRNINSALDLRDIDDTIMRRRTGVTGLRVVHELRGIPCAELNPLWTPRKGITSSRSFGEYVTTLDNLEESVATHATRAAEKLRHDGSVAGELAVFISTNRYANHLQYANTAHVPAIPSSNADNELVRLAIQGVRRIFRSGFKYKKAGVILTNITPAAQRQLDMFALNNIDRQDHLYRAVDNLNAKYGSGTIHPVSCGIKQRWAMRRNYRSPRYTTSWSELPVARL
jgi:DNA polymerase V